MKVYYGLILAGLLSVQSSSGQITPPPPPPNTNTPPTPEQIAAEQAALAAAQQALFLSDFAPWLHQDASALDDPALSQAVGNAPGAFLTTDQRFMIRQTLLQAISTANQTTLDANFSDATNFAQSNNIPLRTNDATGVVNILRSIEGGQPVYYIADDLAGANTLSVPALWTNGSTGLNLNGEGIFTGVFDVGDVLTNHQEFGSRVSNDQPTSSVPIDGHSMHVVGVIASAGINTNAKGIAPLSTVAAFYAIQDFSRMPQVASTNHVFISNHSYGRNVGWSGQRFRFITSGGVVIANGYYPVWNGDATVNKATDYNFGRYNTDATNVDGIVYNAATYLPIWAAGNERGPQGLPNGVAGGAASGFDCETYSGPYGTFVAPGDPNFPTPGADGNATGFYSTLSAHACAKDNLVVGSVTNITGGYQGSNSVLMSYFSSWGPTTDGRIKPDVVAPGENVLFPDTNGTSSYFTDSGTSFSAPAVAGALNLIVEENSRTNGTNAQLLASTLKGLAIHTADEAGTNAGPDYRFGWGLFNAKSATQLFSSNSFSNGLPFIKEVRLFDGDYIQFPVTVTNSTPQLKVTICWTDPPGTVGPAILNATNLALVNDLDLRVVNGGITNFPWVLNPASPTSVATKGDNFRDNVEQVLVTNPAAGDYTITITNKGHIKNASGQNSAQWVSIIATGVQPQAMQPPTIAESFIYSTNQLFALKWNTTVGVNYQILKTTDVASGSWQPATDVINATKTNAAFVLPVSTLTNAFFKIVASRP